MGSRNVADLVTKILHSAGVRRIYGVVGDSLNGITESLCKRGDIDWAHTRHEEAAAFAAGVEAYLTGNLAVCAGSCGPGCCPSPCCAASGSAWATVCSVQGWLTYKTSDDVQGLAFRLLPRLLVAVLCFLCLRPCWHWRSSCGC